MPTSHSSVADTPKRSVGRPFAAGPDPRRAGNGRPRLTAEQRRERELAALAKEKVVNDLSEAMRPYAQRAIEELGRLMQLRGDPSIRLQASREVLSRIFGTPRQSLDLQATVETVTMVDAAMIRQAALHLAAAHAVDAVPVEAVE